MKNHRFTWIILITVLLAFAAIAGYFWLFTGLPSLDSMPARLNTPSVRIVDRHGRLLYEILDRESGRHAVVALDRIPLEMRQAMIATEDRSFYHHPGVDVLGILRALWIDFRGGAPLAGGSTITQQVARNLLLEPPERTERSLRRKLRESYLAWQLTRRYSKDEILAFYLNQTYYGGLAYGVEAAAQTFFAKPVDELDLAECAMLAGLPQAPALYNPFTDLQAAKARQEVVLGLMQEDEYITAEQYALAVREPLVFAETPYPIEAPHFVMMVRAQIDEIFSPQAIYSQGGLVIRTSLDLDWQKHAESALIDQLAALEQSEDGLGHNTNNAALAALDPRSGEILAMVGSPDYFDAENSGSINMTISPRQPGSALKPLVYAVALDPANAKGEVQANGDPNHLPQLPWTAATMLLDVQTSFITHDGRAYTPTNYDLREHGPVSLRDALGSSLNIPAVLTLDHIGLDALFDLATKMGISTLEDPQAYDLTLALGGGQVRLLELTAAYGVFANGGFRVYPSSILEVYDFEGNSLYTAPSLPQVRVLDEQVTWLISDILSDNDARRIGFGGNSILRLGQPAAVKTGTTSNFHDNWTVGYTSDLVVGVWTGNTDYEPMHDVNGLTGAAPIWHRFMRTVLGDEPASPFKRPPGLVQIEVCALSGLLPSDTCTYRRPEWFIEGTQPTQVDTLYKEVVIDAVSGLLAHTDTPLERQVRQTVLDLPPQAQPWARSEGLTLYSDLLPSLVGTTQSQRSNYLQLLSPATGSVFNMATGFDPDAQRILLEAVGERGLHQVSLWIDGELITEMDTPPYQAWWTLVPGVHQVWAEALNSDGELITSEAVTFEVLSAD